MESVHGLPVYGMHKATFRFNGPRSKVRRTGESIPTGANNSGAIPTESSPAKPPPIRGGQEEIAHREQQVEANNHPPGVVACSHLVSSSLALQCLSTEIGTVIETAFKPEKVLFVEFIADYGCSCGCRKYHDHVSNTADSLRMKACLKPTHKVHGIH